MANINDTTACMLLFKMQKNVRFIGGLECVRHSFAYVSHIVFLRDVWIRAQRASVASRRATNLASLLADLDTHLPNLATLLPNLAIHLPSLQQGSYVLK